MMKNSRGTAGKGYGWTDGTLERTYANVHCHVGRDTLLHTLV